MRISKIGLGFIACVSYLATAEEPKRLSLKEFLATAVSAGPGIRESQAKVEFSKAREKLAASVGLPSLKLDYMGGLAPGASGNAVDGQTQYDRWGVSQGAGAEILFPVFTFGAISYAKDAAQLGTQAEESLLEKDELSLRTQVAEIYYGYQLAFELTELASSVVAKLTDAREKGKKLPKTKASDLDKLEVYILDTQARVLEAEKALSLTRSAMAWKMGCLSSECLPKWDSASLTERSWNLKIDNTSLKEMSQKTLQFRPELIAAKKNIEARKALMDSEESQLWPMVFLGASVFQSWTPGRENQTSPYAYDPLNELRAVAGVGVRWNLGFFEKSAKIAMAKAELSRAEAIFANANAGFRAEFEKVVGEANFLKASLEMRTKAARISKRVFYDSVFAFSLGSGSAKDILEALGAYGLAEKSRLETLYNFNVQEFRLAQILGVKLEN